MSNPQIQSNSFTASIDSAGFNFFSEEKKYGFQGLELAMSINGEEFVLENSDITQMGDGLQSHGNFGNSNIACESTLTFVDGGCGIEIRHKLTNTGDRNLFIGSPIARLKEGNSSFCLGKASPYDFRYCHTDNLRTERFPYSQGEYPYVRNLPTREVLLGIGEDQPYPTLYFVDRKYETGILVAASSQDLSYQAWRLCKASSSMRHTNLCSFEIIHDFVHSDRLVIPAGESIELDGTYFLYLENTHPQDLSQNYTDLLAKKYDFRGPSTSMLDSAFYCSWNYGRFHKQDQKDLRQTAKFISENFPKLKVFLVDAGYMADGENCRALSASFLDNFYPDPNANVHKEFFPDGMKAFSRELQEMGLRPGIWWTPMAGIRSKLGREHPEWFLRSDDGGFYRIGESGYLDLNIPEARDFVDRVLSVVVGEWEMQAVKMDFWSQSCEGRGALSTPAGSTALQSRMILFELVRKHLPDDGVFLTCVATGMGNPFIGTHADSYRNTIDIGVGTWHEQILNCLWALPTLGLEGRKTFLLNHDSAGVSDKFPDNENFFRLTWCFITMGMQEISGELEKIAPQYVEAFKKYTDRCDRGYRCLCPDESAFTGEPFPKVLYVDYPEGSPTQKAGVKKSVAFFNWGDDPNLVSVSLKSLGLEGSAEAENFWTGEKESFEGEFITKRLEGRSALLYDIV